MVSDGETETKGLASGHGQRYGDHNRKKYEALFPGWGLLHYLFLLKPTVA